MINQANRYKKLPSEIAKIEDEYTAFCFDEACMYISNEIEKGNTPKWADDVDTLEDSRYKASSLAERLRSKGGAD